MIDRTLYAVEITMTGERRPYVERVFKHEAKIHCEIARKQGYLDPEVKTQAEFEAERKERKRLEREERIARHEEKARKRREGKEAAAGGS